MKASRDSVGGQRAPMGGMTAFFLALILSVFGGALLDSHLLNEPSLAAVVSATLVDLTNADRGENKLGGLAVSPVLTVAAQAKADDMAAKGYFAHVSPDGHDSWYWFAQANYSFLYAGENLAVDFSDSSDVEQAWMNSPAHRANILDGHFTQVGIATAHGTFQGRPTTFVVQLFGTPAPVTAPVRAFTSPAEPTAPALATTRPAVTARIASATPAAATAPEQVLGATAAALQPPSASFWQRLLASPRLLLSYGYSVLAVLVLLTLAFVTELEFHRRHLSHVTAAVLLFVLMTVLFSFASFTLFSTPVIAAG